MVFSFFKRFAETNARAAESEALRLEKAAQQARKAEEEKRERRLKSINIADESESLDSVSEPVETGAYPSLRRGLGPQAYAEPEEEGDMDEPLVTQGPRNMASSSEQSADSIPKLRRW